MNTVLSAIGALAAIYVLIVVGMVLAQRTLIYRPDAGPHDETPADLPPPEEIDQRADDGLTTRSWLWLPSRDGLPVLVYFHGNAGYIGHRRGKVETYVKAGLGVMLVGYRGYGGNPGKPTEQGLYADARAALGVLRDRGFRDGDIILYGESLGSGVATQMASERRVAAMILEAPVSSVADVAQAHYPILPAHWLVTDRFDNVGKIASIGAPLLILHGHRDDVVAFRFGRRLFNAACEPKQLAEFPAAKHNDLYDYGAAATVLAFLKTHGHDWIGVPGDS